MKNSKEILEIIQMVEMEGKRAYMLGKQLDISSVMTKLQLEFFANAARIKELLEKNMGEKPLDYESLPEQGIGLDGNMDSKEREEEKIITLE